MRKERKKKEKLYLTLCAFIVALLIIHEQNYLLFRETIGGTLYGFVL